MPSLAHVEGSAAIHSPAAEFLAAFARRVRAGLLAGTSGRRNRYVITREDAGSLAFRADSRATAFNVGLNQVQLTVSTLGRVHYAIDYRRWAKYAVVLSAVFGVAFMILLLVGDVRGYIERHAASRLPGLSVQQNVAVAWLIALFWGFVWPWILIAAHRGPVRRLLERIIGEVDAAGRVADRPPVR